MPNFLLVLSFLLGTTSALGQMALPQSVHEYNEKLIDFGVSWKTEDSTFYPSFYTGFAPKIEDANRIFFKLGRGNQARLTGTLDEMTVLTYPYQLKGRAEFIDRAFQTVIDPQGMDQASSFKSVALSHNIGLQKLITDFEAQRISREVFYQESLRIIKELNPGRIFSLRIDLRKAFLNWRTKALSKQTSKFAGQSALEIAATLRRDAAAGILLANDLLPGRVNVTYLNDNDLQMLSTLIFKSLSNSASESDFVEAAAETLNALTRSRFQFRVVDQGQYRTALDCRGNGSCDLVFAEFTAIYPVGSVRSYTKDRDGNNIPTVREVGSMNFIDRTYHDVDHIRSEGFYGWMPKMDYTESGNGIHNPAVKTDLKRSIYEFLYDALNIPKEHNNLWVVARGGVSNGCTRMAAGHIHEVRHVFPSRPSELKKLIYNGSHSSDYDLYDIDGTGQLRVMGVNYQIAYALAAGSGAGYREGNGFIDEALKRMPFYNLLYGKKQFRTEGDNLVFLNPYESLFSGNPGDQRAKVISRQHQGEFSLYEQTYEKDKIQFFTFKTKSVSSLTSGGNKNNRAQQLVRVFGRQTACGPFKREFSSCNEEAFLAESAQIFLGLK